jgi:hypothetical protein
LVLLFLAFAIKEETWSVLQISTSTFVIEPFCCGESAVWFSDALHGSSAAIRGNSFSSPASKNRAVLLKNFEHVEIPKEKRKNVTILTNRIND